MNRTPDRGRDFATFLRSAGKLALARQASALVLTGVVLALPVMTSATTATEFVWAYFAMLTLTSALSLGLERLAGTLSGARGDTALGRALAPVLVVRVATVPLAAVGLWALLAFVSVHLSAVAWWSTLLWISAGLLGPVLFGGLRAAGNSTVEPSVMVGVRTGQALAIAAVAASSSRVSVAVLVTAAALIESTGVVVALRSVRRVRGLGTGRRSWHELPLRRAAALAGIDLVGLANLRADLLLVGRMLGAGAGATYGLLYRAVDAFNGVVGSGGLWLYAESANDRDGGTDAAGIRARALVLLPRLGIAVGALAVLAAGPVAGLIPRLGAEVDTLRVLAVAFPILTVNAVEVHVRSGRGRNREVLGIYAATLVLNVPACAVLVGRYGLVGAAVALAASELFEAVLLLATASVAERALVGPALRTAVTGAVLLGLTTASLGSGHVVLVALGMALTAVLVLHRNARPKHAPAVAS